MRGWYCEKEDDKLWPGQRFCLKVKEPLHREQSEFQDIEVFETTNHGRCLVLDGAIQLTEWDEWSYQEMITHLPMFAHPNPENVLIIGAGDGGVLREVCRHKGVKKVTMCEIDRKVVEVSKTFLNKSTAVAFDDPRATLLFADAAKFVDSADAASFDVVIVDSSDPNDGPANSLFSDEFYANLARVLKPGGIVCTQGECMWLHTPLIKSVLEKAKKVFPSVDYAYTCTPTYPCGQIGFLLCSKSTDAAYARRPRRAVPAEMAEKLQYYSHAMHKAAFLLPSSFESQLSAMRASQATCTGHSRKDYAIYAGVLAAVGAVGFALGKAFASRK